MTNLSTSSVADLTSALRSLKLYRSYVKRIGKRGSEIFQRERSGVQIPRVQYFGDIQTGSIEPLVLQAFDQHFSVRPEAAAIVWERNDSIRGGVRIFLGDDMVDVSFQEVANRFKK